MSEHRYILAAAAAVGLLAGTAPGHAGDRVTKDTRLEARVDADLKKDERLADRVDAQATKGKVTLTGSVETEADKVRAEQLARTRGAKQIDNQVTVQPAAGQGGDQAQQQGQKDQQDPQAPGATRALSDPYRRDPLVGAMPAEQTGSRELRLRTLGMEDPKVQRQREEARKQQEQQQQGAAPAGKSK